MASILQNLICYVMMITLPTQMQHKAVFVSAAICLALAQLHKQFYTPGVNGLDVPMNLMFNFCKLTSLVCCVRDGLQIQKYGAEKSNLKKREI